MINKLISSVILAACFPILAITPSHQASLLFIFISGNKLVATFRLAVALIMFAVSFRLINFSLLSKNKQLYTGLGLIVFGIFMVVMTSVDYFLYDYMKLLDVFIVLEAGIILCNNALITTQKRAPALANSKKRSKPRMTLSRA
jgi:hypothetical protein